jgi:hypothetical protein
MRSLLLLLTVLVTLGCSDDQSGLTPAERAKKGRGMSEEYWKVYSGTESGVSDAPASKPQEQPAKSDQPKGSQ